MTSFGKRQLIWSLPAWLLSLACLSPARGYTPDHPKVLGAAQKATEYLINAKLQDEMNAGKLGGEAVIGLAIYKMQKKNGEKDPHPRVMNALQRVRSAASTLAREDNYSLGIALIFLSEVQPERNGAAMLAYTQEILRRQKPHGGWGYTGSGTGDVSQTQYAVLGMWSAYNAGINVPMKPMEDVLHWFIRVQAPDGGFGYQGRDSGSIDRRVEQEEVSLTLAAAALGSFYVGADFLGLSKRTDEEEEKMIVKLPPCFEPVLAESAQNKRPERVNDTRVNKAAMYRTMNDGNKWFDERYKIVYANAWKYYYMYAVERYKSFQELVEANEIKEPAWYNEGVDEIVKSQAADGHVRTLSTDQVTMGSAVDTAFAVLFLLRSTKETIARVVEAKGVLRGGHGLPKDLSNVEVSRTGGVVAPAITGDVEDLLKMLEDEKADQIESMLAHPDAFSLEGMKGDTSKFRERLMRILRSGSYKARQVAARVLGRQGNLDNVPILVYALTDGDPRVMREARNGLRLTARKFSGFDLPDEPTKAQREKAVQQWKEWYLTIRPDADFLDIPPVQ